MECSKCQGTSFDTEGAYLQCTSCGFVIEDIVINSEVEFNSQKVTGNLISNTSKNQGSSGYSLYVAHRDIQSLAKKMSISEHDAGAACRAYTYVRNDQNFVKGRKMVYVLASCLYFICREHKVPYLLIDFADAINDDVLALAKVYKKLVRVLKLDHAVPVIDPSLFIERYCSKLDFGEKKYQVAMTANRLVQRMKRDWISSGRRPTGLCAAAILISAKFHEVPRSIQKIQQVVRVCNDTILKRIDEFKNTKIASLTREEFEAIDIESFELEVSDPPAFRPYKKMKAIKEAQAEPVVCEQKVVDNLSDIDEGELDEFILTEEESHLKSLIWHQLNRDWIEKQEQKLTVGSVKKEEKRDKPQEIEQADNPADAVKNSGKLPNAVNQDAIADIFNTEKPYENKIFLNKKTKQKKKEDN